MAVAKSLSPIELSRWGSSFLYAGLQTRPVQKVVRQRCNLSRGGIGVGWGTASGEQIVAGTVVSCRGGVRPVSLVAGQACAIRAHANTILTLSTRNLPKAALASYGSRGSARG
jgi:hypothetical protein